MKKKFKQMPLILGGLSAIALGTVGFSAWVITGSTTEQKVSNVQIHAAEVQDRRMEMTIASDASKDTSILFAGAEGGTVIKNSDTSGQKEDLDFGFKLTVTNALSSGLTKNEWFPGLKVDLNITDNSLYDYQKCIDEEYIIQPFTSFSLSSFEANVSNVSDTNGVSYTAKNVDGNLEITFKFSYKWGLAFDLQNPTTWDGEKFTVSSQSDPKLLKDTDSIKTALETIYKLNDSVSYDVTVSMFA